MKRVVIGMRDGEPYVISKPAKVDVIIRTEKRRSFRKVVRTLIYRIKTRIAG